jgi:hypothetical protein
MRAEHPTPNKVPYFPAQQLADFGKFPYTIWDFFPAVWTCPWDIQRVGRLGDGGKWVCGMSKYEDRTDRPTIIYSFGVNDESTFEEEILERTNAELYAFDYSVDDVRSSFSFLGLSPLARVTTLTPHTVRTAALPSPPLARPLQESRSRRREQSHGETPLLHPQVAHGPERPRLHVRPPLPLPLCSSLLVSQPSYPR